jgi:hypothetical protein
MSKMFKAQMGEIKNGEKVLLLNLSAVVCGASESG